MVHTNPEAAGRFFNYYNLPHQERIRMSQRRNPSYNDRFRNFAHRSYLVERGLDLSRIENARAVQIAEERSWLHYIQNPEAYDPALVSEFYAAMMPPVFEEFSTVIVRGRTIRMTNDDIAEFYRTPRHPELDPTFGIPPIPGVQQDETHSEIISSSLRRNGRGRWVVRSAEIKKSELEPELGLWLLFIKGSLAPSAYHTTLNPYVARIMYCIQHRMPLDVGLIIRLHMIDAAAENCIGVLPFPCLITQFCRDAGIETGLTIPSFAPYNRTTYRQQVTAADKLTEKERLDNERMNIPHGVDAQDADDVDYDPAQDEGHQQTGSYAQFQTRMDLSMEEMRTGFAMMRRGFRYLGVPDEVIENPDEAEGAEPPPVRQRRRRQQGEASSSRSRHRN